MIRRKIQEHLSELLQDFPAVALLGPRQVGKTTLAYTQGGVLNAAALARGLGVDGKTIASYLDLMVDLLLVRRLQPWHSNAGKRLVKSPKVYVRDSGITYALLGLRNKEDVLGHPGRRFRRRFRTSSVW